MPDSQTDAEAIGSSQQSLKTNLDTEDSNLEADVQKDASSTSTTDSTSNEPTNSSPDLVEQQSSSEDSQTVGSSPPSTQTSTDSSQAKETLAENSQSKEISPNNSSNSSQPRSQSFPSRPDTEVTLNDSSLKKDDEVIDTKRQSQLPARAETIPRDSTASLSTTDPTVEPKLTESAADYKPPISKVLPYQGLPNILPSVPWASTPLVGATNSQTSQASSSRKLTSPFSWLSRTTAKEASTTSVMSNQQGQSVVASSTATRPSFETTSSKTDEGEEPNGSNSLRRPGRGSLKDRFKMLRLQEEVGITSLAENGGSSNEQSKNVQTDQGRSNNIKSKQSPTSKSPVSTSPGPSLPPGMASGISEGPSHPVDWDLWQSVVDEGPTAVARSSPEELNRAITSGIPNAIRGVVWQILAQSRNEELESMYKDLVLRGTEKERDRMSGSSGFASIANSLNGKDEQVASSSSSVSSEHSVANSIATGLKSPTTPKDSDNTSKLQATAVAERKKKAKEDAESVKKLEKMIKRDLGARTSFSKFATSAGLQDGLFGVCKAYALFDEGVGYAQGMNFLVMPLLFN
ncbi:GTPase-activating protein (GAP), partial [Blumeria graminis f. sp. tritici 96224]